MTYSPDMLRSQAQAGGRQHDGLIYLALFGFSIVLLIGVGFFQSSPGYMDAEYYYAGGVNLAQGHGFTQNFLWNYLDSPAGLPHPSHSYWMPLASILAYLGMVIGGSVSFSAGKSLMILIAGLLPPVCMALCRALGGRRDQGVFAGLLALFPGFYLSYLPTTDTFGIVMLLGAAVCLLLIKITSTGDGQASTFGLSLALGAVGGLIHLARADGVLWLACIIAALMWNEWKAKRGIKLLAVQMGLCLAGYLLIMGPWMVRNWSLFGTPLSLGGDKALWLTTYDELFSYPGDSLTFGRWWSTGLSAILQARLWALGQNIQTTLAVQGEIFLFPLILAGVVVLRKSIAVQAAGLAWLLTFAAMTLAFPFAGARGSFFHSGSALQPLFFAVAPFGMDVFVRWGGHKRGWRTTQARKFFTIGWVGLAVILTLMMTNQRVIGDAWREPGWNESANQYALLEHSLAEYALPGDVVMVNNPPGYFLASQRPSIVIPDGGVQTLLSAAKQFGARYVILEKDHPDGLDALYEQPDLAPGLQHLITLTDSHIFAIVQP